MNDEQYELLAKLTAKPGYGEYEPFTTGPGQKVSFHFEPQYSEPHYHNYGGTYAYGTVTSGGHAYSYSWPGYSGGNVIYDEISPHKAYKHAWLDKLLLAKPGKRPVEQRQPGDWDYQDELDLA